MRTLILFVNILFLVFITNCKLFTTNQYSEQTESIYKTSLEIEQQLRSDTGNLFRYELASWYYSFIGNDNKSLEFWDSSRIQLKNAYGWKDTDKFNVDSVLQRYPLQKNAVDAIVEHASQHKITIINEGHHMSINRLFTNSLLKELYNIGYRHLGLEAIINTSQNPYMNKIEDININSGLYIQDPEFSEMVKNAIQIGYKIFEYEAIDTLYNVDREISQAQNIANYSNLFPKEKILIHCGFNHLIEVDSSKYSNYPLMGRQLSKILKLNPLTIDQYRYTNKSDKQFEHELYTKLHPLKPVVLFNEKGDIFSNVGIDISVFLPKVEYFRPKRTTTICIDDKLVKKFHLPLLILIFRKDDNINKSIPKEVIEIKNNCLNSNYFKASDKLVIQDGRKNRILLNQGNFRTLTKEE